LTAIVSLRNHFEPRLFHMAQNHAVDANLHKFTI
jgi:hypothetical protein